MRRVKVIDWIISVIAWAVSAVALYLVIGFLIALAFKKDVELISRNYPADPLWYSYGAVTVLWPLFLRDKFFRKEDNDAEN